MIEYIFNEDEMLAVAKAVVKYNKYRQGSDPQEIVEHMKRTMKEALHSPGFVGAVGYVLTAYDPQDAKFTGPGIQLGIKASVDAHILSGLIG